MRSVILVAAAVRTVVFISASIWVVLALVVIGGAPCW
jgi:hypothetical protein